MPFSRYILDFVGSMPAPTDYPNPAKIAGWTDALGKGYVVDIPKIAEAHPTDKILGSAEMGQAVTQTIQAIITNQAAVRTALQQLTTQLNEIVQRHNPA